MIRILLFCCLIGCASVVQAQQDESKKGRFTMAAGMTARDYLPNTIIVKFKPSARSGAKIQSVRTLGSLKSAAIKELVQKFPEKTSDARTSALSGKQDSIGLSRIFELKFSGNAVIEDVITEVLADENVEYAEPSYIYHTSYSPDDPAYRSNLQSYLNQIKAGQAWDLVRNLPAVKVAIVDSGSDLDHEDLAANIFINTADPVNGIDDDHDGYIDNYNGWDIIGANGLNPVPDNDPNVKSSASDHGVHVSGIAAAITDNAKGISSVAFNAIKLLIVKVGADNNSEDIFQGYEGIKYAVDDSAKIINCSWGGEVRSQLGADIVNYAIANNCLIIAAAGNIVSGNAIEYPAAFPGVFTVANVTSADVRASSSKYGNHVSISAPGTNIYSTTYNNTYGYKTGTSMATPVVSSAAALVRASFPELNMQQVGEQLRVTADKIDNLNPSYAGKIGSGRLNVYRSLTEKSPSIRYQNLVFRDNGNGAIPAGDTLTIYVDLKNFLFEVTNLEVSLSSTNTNVNVMPVRKIVPLMGSLQTANGIGAFKVYVKSGTPDNTLVDFRINYTANEGTYQDSEGFSLIVAKDYLDVSTNYITTTFTSNGRLGYSDSGRENGAGFTYKGAQMLYESALMIGNSATSVSNNVRATNSRSDEHFVKRVRIEQLEGTPGVFAARAEFDDSANPSKLNVRVSNNTYVQAADDKYVISEYEVANQTSASLSNVYIAMFTDWDITDASQNATAYDPASRLAYVYDKKSSNSAYAGVKLLSSSVAPAYYPLSNTLSGNILQDDLFSVAEKFQTLSSGVKATSLGADTENGLDVAFVSGYGPFTIPAYSSVKVAFAVIGGDDLNDIKQSAALAEEKYKVINAEEDADISVLNMTAYPNPVTSTSGSSKIGSVKLFLPEGGKLSLELVNLQGQRVRSLVENQPYPGGVHVIRNNMEGLVTGIYLYKLRFNNKTRALKVVLE